MGAFLGLMLGLGLLLIWHGLSSVPTPRPSRPPFERTRERLLQAGLPSVSPAQLFALQALSAVLVAVLGLALTQSISVSLIFALFAGAVPHLMVSRLRHKRQADLRELWPEVVDNLTSGVRAGLSLPEALTAIGDRGPEQLREPFRQFGADYRTTGRFNDSLDRLKATLADPVGDRVIESLRVAREVGGTDLGRLLSTLSGFLRDDARTRAELLARQTWSVNAARMAVAAPWLVLLFMSFQSDVIHRYASGAGIVVLTVGAVACVVAYRLMMRIGRLPTERRILS